jgi:Chaperone of endosialidase
LGYQAGQNLTTGNNNIDIGNPGIAGDANAIRIGTSGVQNRVFIAGINNSLVTGLDVVVNSNGRLGIVMSSARYKKDIQNMGARSRGLLKLRPVTFRYKQDPTGERQYGLIAEEVAQVYPELVSYGPDGKIQSVHYQELIPMLLNELQQQASEIAQLKTS